MKKSEKLLKARLENMSIEELNTIIESEQNFNTKEKFFAKKELKIREYLNYDPVREGLLKKLKREEEGFFTTKEIVEGVKIFLSISIVLISFYFLFFHTFGIDTDFYNTEAKGEIDKIVEKEVASHGGMGSDFGPNTTVIVFNYEVLGKNYSNEMRVGNKSKEREFLYVLRKKYMNKKIPIRYNKNNPLESLIDFEKMLLDNEDNLFNDF